MRGRDEGGHGESSDCGNYRFGVSLFLMCMRYEYVYERTGVIVVCILRFIG